MANGDILQLVMKGELDGQATNNVLNFRDQSGILGSNESLAEAYMDCVVTHLLPALSSDFKLKSVVVKKIWPEVGDEHVEEAPPNSQGSISGSLPSFNAAVLSHRTGSGGRSGRGRTYIAGLANSGETASTISSGLEAALLTFVACLFSKFVGSVVIGAGYQWGIFSRKNFAATPANEASWWRPVTSTLVSPDVATMRSRKLKQGD